MPDRVKVVIKTICMCVFIENMPLFYFTNILKVNLCPIEI